MRIANIETNNDCRLQRLLSEAIGTILGVIERDTRGWEDGSARAERLLALRLEKIAAWLDWLDDVSERYEEIVISRAEETASLSGFDREPRYVVCRHPRKAMLGRLCLICNNTGFASKRDIPDGEPVDPYSLDTPKSATGIRTDQSPAGIRAAHMERLNAAIAALQRDSRLRAGAESQENQSMRLVRLVESTHHSHPILRRLVAALGYLRQRHPSLYRAAVAREYRGLMALEVLLPGRLPSRFPASL